MGKYSDALDGLADTYRWCQTERGRSVIGARGKYLLDNTFNALDVDVAQISITESLVDAEAVFWTDKLCAIVEKSAPLLPATWRLTSPMLFTQSGYIWFEKPITLSGNHGKRGCNLGETLTAISWSKRPRSVFLDIVYWVRPSKPNIANIFLPDIEDIDKADQNLRDQSVHVPHELIKRLHQAKTNPLAKERLVGDMAVSLGLYRQGGIPWVITPWRLGETIEKTFSSSVSDGFIDGDVCVECNMIFARSLGASLNFLSTKVFISTTRAPDRATIRRIPSKPRWSNVNVVTLRHAERVYHAGEQEGRDVEWAGHWLVGSKDGGFWRHQPVKNANGEWIKEWRWIAQYIKGDLSKPFMPPKKRTYIVNR